MDVTSETFLTILKFPLNGEKCRLNKEVSQEEWKNLFSMHCILLMFYETAYTFPSLQQINAPYIAIAKNQAM